ncbi:GNAT family N-acetyltransferase [Candidatus Bathyarchaeota archaeon]|nr:GNAT family N-acetyltransferase [Candidatus Bathyarchaeota archaeon]
MKVKEVDIYSLKETWNNLLKNNLLGDNIFLTWEWLSTWWKHFGKEKKNLVLLVMDENEVVGIAPLMLSKYKLPGFGSIKKVEFIGSRQSDYNNFIIIKKEAECLRLITEYLTDSVEHWDWIELKEIPETAKKAHYLEKLFRDISFSLRLRTRICNICPYVPLPDSFDQLINGLSKNMRQNLNKYQRRIKENYHVELKRYDEARLSVKEAMELFITLHEKRWILKGLPGAFRNNDTFRNFHMEIAERFANSGWLGLYFLMSDGEPVSAQYTFEYGQKMYYYLAGFDPEYSNYSVGNLMTLYLLERCIKKGFREYDMMRGIEPYKAWWTQSYKRNFEIRLVRGGLLRNFCDWITWNKAITSLVEKTKLSLKAVSI